MRAVLLLILACVIALPAAAHESGASYEAVIDGYTVDIGYSTDEPTADDVVLLDFVLREEEDTVPFSDAWVKVTDEHGAVVFAGGIHNAQYGGARMSYRFPGEGRYVLSVRYEEGDVALAEAAVPFTVAPGADTGEVPYLVPLVAAGAVLAVLAALLVKRRA